MSTKLSSEQLSVEWDVEMFHKVLKLVYNGSKFHFCKLQRSRT